MTDMTTSQTAATTNAPDTTAEALFSPPENPQGFSSRNMIERRMTFKRTTYRALKLFMADHAKATGEHRNTASIIDWLLRRQLGNSVNPAVREALHQAVPEGAEWLTYGGQEGAAD